MFTCNLNKHRNYNCMHINFDAVTKEAASLQVKPGKHKLHLSTSSLTSRKPPFEVQFILRILRSSEHIKNTLNELCIWFGSCEDRCLNQSSPQPLFLGEPGVKNGWADPNYISRFKLIQTPYFTWTSLIEFYVKYGVWTGPKVLFCSPYAASFETDGSLPRREKILAKAANVPPTPCLKKKGQTTVVVKSSFIKHTILILKN